MSPGNKKFKLPFPLKMYTDLPTLAKGFLCQKSNDKKLVGCNEVGKILSYWEEKFRHCCKFSKRYNLLSVSTEDCHGQWLRALACQCCFFSKERSKLPPPGAEEELWVVFNNLQRTTHRVKKTGPFLHPWYSIWCFWENLVFPSQFSGQNSYSYGCSSKPSAAILAKLRVSTRAGLHKPVTIF